MASTEERRRPTMYLNVLGPYIALFSANYKKFSCGRDQASMSI